MHPYRQLTLQLLPTPTPSASAAPPLCLQDEFRCQPYYSVHGWHCQVTPMWQPWRYTSVQWTLYILGNIQKIKRLPCEAPVPKETEVVRPFIWTWCPHQPEPTHSFWSSFLSKAQAPGATNALKINPLSISVMGKQKHWGQKNIGDLAQWHAICHRGAWPRQGDRYQVLYTMQRGPFIHNTLHKEIQNFFPMWPNSEA